MKPSLNTCGRCGAALPSRALDGLCPDCLIRVSLRPLTQPTTWQDRKPEPPLPSQMGDFELLEEIGRGGMGIVWRARQTGLNRVVALKTIRPEALGSEAVRQRFRAEAETAATLSHPNIVPVFEFGETAGRAWFAMQLVEGDTLADHLADGQWAARHCPAHRKPVLPWPCRPRCCPRGAALVVKLARAVHHAHQHGVLHGDLKPGNILLDEEGEPHITDFGLARWLDRLESACRAGEVVGTPSYMAPEQARGDALVTTAADIYSLGAIGYHILTGRPPFLAETAADTLRQACEDAPPLPRSLNPEVDRDLEAICLKCLAKDPAARYTSAASLADDLDRWSRAENIRARQAGLWERSCRWARRKPATFALTITLHLTALAGLAGVLTQWFRAERQATARQAAVLQARQQLVDMQVANGMRSVESADLLGALPWFAEAVRLQPTNELFRLALANVLRAAPTLDRVWQLEAHIHDAAWSLDGRRVLAGAENGRVLVADPNPAANAGDAERPFALPRFPAGVRRVVFSPEGAAAALGCADGRVFLIELAGGGLREMPGGEPGAVRVLAFSADGRLLAAGGEDRRVRLWSLPEGGPPATLPHGEVVTDLAFSPDSSLLVSTDLGGMANVWRATDGARAGEAIRSREGLFAVSFPPDGARLVTAGADGGANLWRVEDRQRVGLRMPHLTWIAWAGFSPDGRQVATCSEDTTARLWDGNDGHPLTPPLRHEGRVMCAGFDGRGRRLATGGGDQSVRLWSVPDGSPLGAPLRHGGAITKVAWQPGGRLLLTASADGLVRLWNPEPVQPSTVPERGFVTWNAWFAGPRDRFIASGPAGRVRVFHAANAEPASPLLDHPAVVDQAAISPDGARLLTACRDTWARVWELASGRLIAAAKLTNAVLGVAWSPDGSSCAAFADEAGLDLLDAATGRTLARLGTDDAQVDRAAFSPDGQLLVAACRNGVVWRWRLEVGAAPQMLGAVRVHAERITSVAFSPEGRRLLTAGRDGFARLTEISTGKAMGDPMAHSDGVEDARFDEAGQRVVTASDDGTARVWDATTGRPLGPPLRPQGGVHGAQFSRDGRFVLTRNADAVQVWDTATGTLVRPRFAPAQPVAGAGFSPDSRRLWVVSEAPCLYTLDLTPGAWTADDWQFAARFLSCREVDPAAGLVAWSPRPPAGGAIHAVEPGMRWERLRQTFERPVATRTE